MKQKTLLGVLIKENGKLFLIFLVGFMLIISLQNWQWPSSLIKFVSMSIHFLCIFLINIALMYYFSSKKKKKKDRIWKKTFAVGYLLSFIIFLVSKMVTSHLQESGILVDGGEFSHIYDTLTGWRLIAFLLYANLVLYSFVFLVQNFILSQYEKNRIQIELLQLKSANIETTNQLLQQQIQPHFLFNALNILKSLIRKDPKSAEAYLIKLSDFIRVSISKNRSGKALLKDELKVCDDYMDMQRIRFGDALRYEVLIAENDKVMSSKLPFFSLQPLLENAIKHNELTIDNPLHITVEKSKDYIVISNNLQKKSISEISTGYGHQMLQERYRILSEDKLIVEKSESHYKVKLKIL